MCFLQSSHGTPFTYIYMQDVQNPPAYPKKLSGVQELRRVLPDAMIEKTILSQSAILTIKGTLKL